MFSIVTLSIKFDCVVLPIFQSFHIFVSFIFHKLAPPNTVYVSKDVLNHYLVHCSAFNSLKSAKNVVFSHSAFWSTCQWGGGGGVGGAVAPHPFPGYAAGNTNSFIPWYGINEPCYFVCVFDCDMNSTFIQYCTQGGGEGKA